MHTAEDGTLRQPDEQIATGDSYHWTYVHYFAHGGKYLLVEPRQLIRFTFGTMTVDIYFREVGEATEVDLHQTNCAIEDPERAWQHVNCRSCWIYFMTNLRSVLAGGPDITVKVIISLIPSIKSSKIIVVESVPHVFGTNLKE